MAISLVQSKSGTWSTPSIAFNSNTTAGNCVVFMLTDTGSLTASSAAQLGGSAGNFSKLEEKSVNPSGTHCYSAIWADPNCAGGQTAITWTDTGTPAQSTYWIGEFSGMASSSVLDTGNTSSGTGGSWTASFASTVASELWLGVFTVASGGGVGNAGNGWTFVNVNDSSGDTDVYGWQAVSSTGTATFSGTGAGSKGWCLCTAGLKGSTAFTPHPNPGPRQAVMRSAVW